PLLQSWPGVLSLRVLGRSPAGYMLSPKAVSPLLERACEKGGHVWTDRPPESSSERKQVYVFADTYAEERSQIELLEAAGFVAWGFYGRILPWQMDRYWASQGRPPEKGRTEVKFAMLGLS